MRSQGFLNGFTYVILFLSGVVQLCLAAHGHRHDRDVLGRIMHKSKACAGSSFDCIAIVSPFAGHSHPLSKTTDAPSHSSAYIDQSNITAAPSIASLPTAVPLSSYQTLSVQQHQPAKLNREEQERSQSSSSHLHDPTGAVATSIDSTASRGFSSLYASSPTTLHPSRSLVPRQDDSYQSFVLNPFPRPAATTSATATTPSSVCPAQNGTTFTSNTGVQYQIVCDVDYMNNDYPFQLVDNFEACVQECDSYNEEHHGIQCLAALFVPSREDFANDCYLKSSVEHPSHANIAIEGAIRLSDASTSGKPQPSTIVTSTPRPLIPQSSSQPSVSRGSDPGVTYATGNNVITPKVTGSHLHGAASNSPSKQYIDVDSPPVLKLANSLLTTGVNGDLTTGYDISPNTGVLDVNITTQAFLRPLSQTPHLSRDGGRGGTINGQHLFLFCDTGSYSTATSASNGDFLGFVSSSCATDVGMNGLTGKPLNLQDGIGQWSDDSGRQRGFAPLTQGELAYNLAKQGDGQRYAVWPESSIIPLDATSGILFAPIVYDNVNRVTRATVFTYTGATLLTITAGGKGGPSAVRTVDKMFDQNEIEWGCVGGIRSWGSSGFGGDDGLVYIFGRISGGILAGRTSPDQIANRASYQYWDGKSWAKNVPTSSSKAFWIQGQFMDIDVFYSPRHLTFIIVYMTIYADSTFYYRYLEADQGILPPFAPGGDTDADYVENIFKYSWSKEQVLYKAALGRNGKYVYAGGVHQGYYGSNDITNGGSRMLITWTAPTGEDPSSLISEYELITAEIEWS